MASNHISEPLHVLDLPQLYQKPSYAALLNALTALSLQPHTFNQDYRDDDERFQGTVLPNGVTSYLTGIVASPLGWLEFDNEREHLWTVASRCLSDRSGRTGMGNMTRSFIVPSLDGEITIQLKEPALTGDNLGFKTWGSSLFLARYLHRWVDLVKSETTVLELGSGTGLLGLAASAVWHTSVILTDLPEIVPNLIENIHLNQSIVSEHCGRAAGAVLDWSEPEAFEIPSISANAAHGIGIILVADPLYDPKHPKLLVETIRRWLRHDASARVFVSYPLRSAYGNEIKSFHNLMLDIGLLMFEEHEERIRDDWADDFLCRYTIWRWL